MSLESKLEPKEELKQLWELFARVENSIKSLQEYKGNTHYKIQYQKSVKELNKSVLFMEARIHQPSQPKLLEKFKVVKQTLQVILSNQDYASQLKEIESLELFWPDLQLEFEAVRLGIQSFEIPPELSMTEYRLDLEEAIKDYDDGCYISALVLCRRAYEGSLVEAFRNLEKREPIEDVRCKNCDATIRQNSYIGISKLHEWALKKGIVTERLKQVGFLLTDVGAGAAHPPLKVFPRDKELARLGITATIALIKEVASKSPH